MSEAQTTYGVSYIASAPEDFAFELQDIVEVVDAHEDLYLQKGRVVGMCRDKTITVSFDGYIYNFKADQLRKLPDTSNPMDVQVGGNHYKKCKIEPAEYIHANGLDFFQGNIVKYITRFRDKDGKKDLEKIKHYCDMLIQLEYPE